MEQDTILCIMSGEEVGKAIHRIAYDIVERNRGLMDVCLVGIGTYGTLVAGRLQQTLEELERERVPLYELPIWVRVGAEPVAEDVEQAGYPSNKKLVLVNGVLNTGLSVCSAITAILKGYRPACIQLVALVDQGRRQFPVRPDYTGKNTHTSAYEELRLRLRERDGEDGAYIIMKE